MAVNRILTNLEVSNPINLKTITRAKPLVEATPILELKSIPSTPSSSSIGAVLGAGASFIDTINKNSALDTTEVDNKLEEANSFQSNYNNFDDLAANWNDPLLGQISAKDIRGSSVGERLANTAGSVISGAAAGLTFGPIGAIIGGAAGLLSGIGGSIAGNIRANNRSKAINADISKANAFNLNKMTANADNVKTNNFRNDMSNIVALGGPLHSHGSIWDNGVTVINEGGSHEENPFGGVPIGVDQEGTPNLVEEGEVKWNDYVFSKRLLADKKLLKKYNIPFNTDKKSFADIAERFNKEVNETPNDPITKRGFNDSMTKLQMAQEEVRMKKESREMKGKSYAWGGGMLNDGQWLRLMPAVGSGIGILGDILGVTNTPDYSGANLIGDTANKFNSVSAKPVRSYLEYNPFDKNYYLNDLNAQTAATRSAIRDTANGNRAAARANLLAADYNATRAHGDMAIKADQYNLAQRQQIAADRKATDQINSEMLLKAQMANAEVDKLRLQAALQRAFLMQQADIYSSQGRSANYNTFFGNLGNIGQEIANAKMVDRNNTLLYNIYNELKEDNKKKKENK